LESDIWLNLGHAQVFESVLLRDELHRVLLVLLLDDLKLAGAKVVPASIRVELIKFYSPALLGQDNFLVLLDFEVAIDFVL
jgi:hypothetical protein